MPDRPLTDRLPVPSRSGREVVLLASGGADSTTMAYWLQRHGVVVTPVFVNYGQHCAETEFRSLKDVIPEAMSERIERVDISDVYKASHSRLIEEADLWRDEVDPADLYIPYRNLLLMTVGAAFAQTRGLSGVYAAFINSNHAREIDCSSAFFDQLERMMGQIGSVSLELPFRQLSKSDVVKLGAELGVPLGLTYSCQVHSRVPCGACPNCVERLEALEKIR